jgi:hypothetical protein
LKPKIIFFLASFQLSLTHDKIKKGDPITTIIVTGILSQIAILLDEEMPDLDLVDGITHEE